MREVLWTRRARTDLAAIHAFIARDSAAYADAVVRRIIAATGVLREFPASGRRVPERDDASIRELIQPPYRIVYRLVGPSQVHVLTVHHAARRL